MSSSDVYGAAADLLREGRTGCVATVISVSGSAPQRVGAKLLLRPDGSLVGTVGGGRVEAAVLDAARALLQGGGPPRIERYELTASLGMCCGGTMEILLEPVRAADRLVLFGAGHVNHAIAQLAPAVEFRLVVVDARADWNNEERFPSAEHLVMDFEPALEQLALDPGDSVVVATHAHELDQDIVLDLAPVELRYLGMIGSKRKATRALQRLEHEGVEPAHRERVFTPMGLDIGAVTPHEIAVSLLAELIRVRRRPEQAKDAGPVGHMRFEASGGTE